MALHGLEYEVRTENGFVLLCEEHLAPVKAQ